MKSLILLLICLCLTQSHIYSSDSKITYDFDGSPEIYHIYFALETGIGADDILWINWPFKIHAGSDKTTVKVILISFSNNLEIVQTTFLDYPTSSTSSQYYVTFGVALTANKWYEVQIFPTEAPSGSLPDYGLIQMKAISSTQSHFITYDSNLAFDYIYVEDTLGSTGTLTVAASSTSSEKARTSSIYSILIDITPTLSNSNGGNFTLYIHYDSGDAAHTSSGTTLKDFYFMGLCQSVTPATGTAAILNSCEISDDLTEIYFSVNSLTAAQPIRISTQISNPLYVSTRGIRGYYVDFVSGVVQENGYDPDALAVSPIAINDPGSTRVYLLWGIESDYTDADVSSLNIGLYKGIGSSIGPFNSFNNGFQFSETSPIEGRYRVSMYLGASGFLEGSIAHNLPAYSGLSVYCHYDTGTSKLICENVGAFINTAYRYFISGKAYFDSGISSSISGFGDVEIVPIVYDSVGAELSVSLYTALSSGDTITVHDSQQFLDTTGYHSTSARKIGMSQVVSFQDDGTLSSTANAMKGFMTGSNSTIGIVPDLGVSQQLLFLLKVSSLSGAGSGNNMYTKLLYNNKVIGFQSGSESRGLDFVGYQSSTGNWSIEYSPCHRDGYVVCEKYNVDTPTKNTQKRINTTTNFYGLYNFECGDAYGGSQSCYTDCPTACNMFTGYSTSDFGSAVMAMRKVTFNSTQFHSSLYADDTLLDFVFVFLRGATMVSTTLINAYTMVGAKMQNIKASYVNYYDSVTNFNKGPRIPTMIRIAGGVLPTESRNATVIGVFFDDNIDAHTFYTYKDQSYDVGCSTGNCKYYPNTGITLFPNDIWHTMRRVEFYDIPPIQNQFNILVPVTPSVNRDSSSRLPDTLTIAFFSQDHSIGDATGLLKTVSVFRLFGTAVSETITGSISAINGMGHSSNSIDSYFENDDHVSFSGTFNYYINTTNIVENPPNNTFRYGYSTNYNSTYGVKFGAGVTLTSLYYNIFESSTLAFETPPENTAETCTVFGYIYNEQTLGNNLHRDGQWVYTAFCPVDAPMNLYSTSGNIQFNNPQYPLVFTKGFPLRGILTYAYSQPTGVLMAYKHDTGNPSTLVRTCTTAKLEAYNPSSTGKQRATFTISTPQIRMSASGYDGYDRFRIQITLPSISNIAMQSGCIISQPDLSCTASGSSTSTIYVYYNGNDVLTVTYFEIELHATTSGAFGATGDYTLKIHLPQRISTPYVPFGTSSYNTEYCTCTSNFKVGNTAYGTSMTYETPTTLSLMKDVKSPISFNFGSYSFREIFYDTSYFQFNYGFLTTPVSTAKSANNFRCMVFENSNNVLTLSDKWKTLNMNSLNSVKLYPKVQIQDPSSTLFTMKCYGAGVPTGSNTTNMSLFWKDSSYGTVNIQTATQIAIPTTLVGPASGSVTASLSTKRFVSEGMKAFYTFTVTASTALDVNSRIYFDFHFNVGSRLDKEGYVECYTRLNSVMDDSEAVFSYCEFISNQQLVLWNNRDLSASTPLYIDIYNIQQPMSSDTSPNSIVVTVDTDGDYQGGVYGSDSLSDTASLSTAISKMTITDTTLSTTYIRSPQDITIKFDTISTSVISSGDMFYMLFPADYGEWITRSDYIDVDSDLCSLEADNNAGVNVISECQFISKRVLKMTINDTTGHNLHTLSLKNLKSPSKLPEGRFNQYRFKLFKALADQTRITHYTFADYSHHLTLEPNANLIDLSWKYYDIQSSDSLISLTDISEQTYLVYMGYFSNVIELRQSIYPSNFQVELGLTLTSHTETQFLTMGGLTIPLGSTNGFFRFAANSTSTNSGLYTLQFSKTGDTNSEYTQIPPLTIVVSNKQCQLVTQDPSYTLPLNGMTLPINIKGIKCIPISETTISVTSNHSEVSMDTDLSSNKLSVLSNDGELYLVFRHLGGGTLNIGDTVSLTFSFTGEENTTYATIPSITLTIVDPATYTTMPVAQALSSPTLSYNNAAFTLQCSMASTIYWSLGIYPSILNTEALDIQARIIAAGGGLKTNYTEPDDFYMRVYGLNYVATTQTLSKTVYNLKSNTNYIFKYFCMNQLGQISDGQSISFLSLNYGAYLMKVSITFKGTINYGQYHDLSCSLAKNFQIPYNRILTEALHYCGQKDTIFYHTDTSTIHKEANSDGEYVFNFYIIPDYSIPIDSTNSDIRSALALSSTSTTIITSTANFINLPELIQMQTQDIQVFTTPTHTMSDPISGLNSVVVTGSITNMNGFLVVGCMNGVYDANTMTLPTTSNIKKGLFDDGIALKQVKMIFSTQNFNSTIEFSGLPDNQTFTFFYFATSEDPTVTAETTAIGMFNAKTLEALTIDINWNPHMTLSVLFLVLVMLLL